MQPTSTARGDQRHLSWIPAPLDGYGLYRLTEMLLEDHKKANCRRFAVEIEPIANVDLERRLSQCIIEGLRIHLRMNQA